MNILVTGATGLIGSALITRLLASGEHVLAVSRSSRESSHSNLSYCTWEELSQVPERYQDVDAIVNLAGETINQRWTHRAKERILTSRLEAVKRISSFASTLPKAPILIQGSAIGYYGTSDTMTYTEEAAPIHEDFLAQVCQQWERASELCPASRRVIVRIGIVLDSKQGALPRMAMPFKLGLGGPIGGGRQWMSWIHVQDLVQLIHSCLQNQTIAGPVNAVAPEALRQEAFGRTLARVLRRPYLLPTPKWLLRLLLGEMSDLVVKGQHVVPQRMEEAGFEYQFPFLEGALGDLLT